MERLAIDKTTTIGNQQEQSESVQCIVIDGRRLIAIDVLFDKWLNGSMRYFS